MRNEYPMDPFLEISLRSLAVYIFMVLALRLFGKNQLSQLNAGDVILLLLIANALQNAMVGDNTTLQGGLVAALVLFLTNFILKKWMFRNSRLKDLIEDQPKILIKDGKADVKMMQKCEVSMDELEETIREHGLDSLQKVQLAVLEVDGNVSVISRDNTNQTLFSRHRRKFPKRSRNFS